MEIIDYPYKADVNDYMNSPFNVLKYDELTWSADYRNLFVPLDFFNLLWQTRSLVLANKRKPLKVSKQILSLPLNPAQINYFCENLILSFNKIFNPGSNHHDDHELNICLDVLLGEFKKSGCRVRHPAYGEKFILDFAVVKKNVDSLPGWLDKIEYLICAKNYYSENGDTASALLCITEIKHLKELEKIRKLKKSIPAGSFGLPSPVPSAAAEGIKKYIGTVICAIDVLSWKYVFKTESDYRFFINVLAEFFAGSAIDLNFKLSLQRRCKTNFCTALNTIYRHFKSSPLKRDDIFIAILKNLSIFENRKQDGQIYHDLVRSVD